MTTWLTGSNNNTKHNTMKRAIILAILLAAAACYDPKPAKKTEPQKVTQIKQGPKKFTF